MASIFQSFLANRHPKGVGEWSDADSKVEDLFETGSAIAFYNFEDKEPRRGEMFYEFFGDDLSQIRNLVQGTGYRLVFPMDFDAVRSMATEESDDYWHYHFPGLRSLREKGVEGAYMNLVRKMDMAPLFFHLQHHLMVEGDSGNRAGWHLLLVNKGNPMQHTWLGKHGDLVSELSMGDSVLRFNSLNPANEYDGSLFLKSSTRVNEPRLIQEPSRVNEDEVVLDILKAENGDPSLLLLRKMLEQILKYNSPQRLELLESLEPLVMAGRSKDQPLSLEVRVSEQCLTLKVGLRGEPLVIRLQILEFAVYRLFLMHPNGFTMKERGNYTDDLLNLYLPMLGSEDRVAAGDRIRQMMDLVADNGALNQCLSRIKRKLIEVASPTVVEPFIISKKPNQRYTLEGARDLITLVE